MPKKKKSGTGDRIGIIYARYSSHNQKDTSIEQQVRECTEYAKEQGITILRIYEDRAVSGRSDQRPGFQEMMRDAAAGKFEYVIAWKSNRMGRNMLQAMQAESHLCEIGIHVLYKEEDFDDSAAGRFALRSMMNVNQFYSENMAEDIKRGMIDNAVNCKVTGSLPFGYKRDENMHYTLDPPNDEVVREIFGRVASGDQMVDIAADLNARGIRTARGREWGRTSFDSILHNEKYTGVYIYDDVRVDGGIPQIVDEGLYLRVQEVLKTKKNPHGRHRDTADYLLTGKLYCGECKSPMIGLSGTSGDGTLHHYYACRKRHYEKSCSKANVRKEEIEYRLAEVIQRYVLRPEVIDWIADSAMEFARDYRKSSGIGTLEAQLAENKKATSNMLKAIESGIITESTRNRLLELEREQSILTSRLLDEQARMLDYSRDDIISFLSLYQRGDIHDEGFRKQLFDAFLISAYLYDNGTVKIKFSATGKQDPVDLDIGSFDVDAVENSTGSDCSYRVPSGPPDTGYTNKPPVIYMMDGSFVLILSNLFMMK